MLFIWILFRRYAIGMMVMAIIGHLTFSPSVAAAQKSVKSLAHSAVQPLINKLFGHEIASRRAAAISLLNLGKCAIPSLENALLENIRPEQRARVQAVLQNIIRRRILTATRITLNLHNASALQAITAISDQANIDFNTRKNNFFKRLPNHGISLLIHRAPFWQAMLDISRTTGISLYSPNEVDRMGYVLTHFLLSTHPGILSPYSPHVIHGPFLVELTRITYHRNLYYPSGHSHVQRWANVRLVLLTEPRLKLFNFSKHWLHIINFCDDHGHSLMPTYRTWFETPEITRPDYGFKDWCVEFTVPLPMLAAKGTHIADLKRIIRLDAIISYKNLSFVMTKPSIQSHTIHHVTIEVLPARKTLKGYDVGIIVAEPLLDQWITAPLLVRATELSLVNLNPHLFDATGREFGLGGGWGNGATSTIGESVTSYDYPRNKQGVVITASRPVKLTIRVPAAVIRAVIPFDFKNVPLN